MNTNYSEALEQQLSFLRRRPSPVVGDGNAAFYRWPTGRVLLLTLP